MVRAPALAGARVTTSLLLRRHRGLPLGIEEVEHRLQIGHDDIDVIAAGDLDVFVVDAKLLHRRDHRPRAGHGYRGIGVAVHDDLRDVPHRFDGRGLPRPANAASAAQMVGYFAAIAHVPMAPIEWPIR